LLISAIVPISSFNYRLDRLATWLTQVVDPDFDLIFVHDTSNPQFDSSLKDSITKLFRGEFQFIEGNFGNPGSARNAGLISAKGDWITFWDSDDLIDTSAVRSLAMEAARNGAEVAVAPFFIVQGDSQPRLVHITTGAAREIAPLPGIWRFIFHKNVIGGKTFPALQMGEDQVFLLNCHIFNRKVEIGRTPTYTYFKGNPGQLTTNLYGISDLVGARLLVKEICLNSTGEDLKFSQRLLFRQSITLFKHRKLIDITISLPNLLKIYLAHPYMFTGEFIRMIRSRARG
jgi:glycosyltransferase involved in cell wall biosynthesis